MSVDHTHNLIELKDVSFAYPGSEEIVSHISLDVHQGDYLGIIGPNGGGKTTLLKIMLGLLKPSKGQVLLYQQDISNFKDWTKIGYVAQKAVRFDAQFPITVKEVVALGRFAKRGLLQHLTKSDQTQIHQALKEVGMWEYRDRLLSELSGGQQQRVFIARALASEPEIIFLDEPTAGVDISTQKQFYALLKKLNRELNKTLILVSHDLDIVTRDTTELACINKTLQYDSNPQGFLKSPALKEMYGDDMNVILHKH